MEETYLALAPRYWGKGPTIEKAEAELRKQAGDELAFWIVYRMPAGSTEVWVDSWGSIKWKRAETEAPDAMPEQVKAHGLMGPL